MIRANDMLPKDFQIFNKHFTKEILDDLNDFFNNLTIEMIEDNIPKEYIEKHPEMLINMIKPSDMIYLLDNIEIQKALFNETYEIRKSDNNDKEKPNLLISIIDRLNIEGYGDTLLHSLSVLPSEYILENHKHIIENIDSTSAYLLPTSKGIMKKLKEDEKKHKAYTLFSIMKKINRNKSMSYRQSMKFVENILPPEYVVKNFKYIINMLPGLVVDYVINLPQVKQSFVEEANQGNILILKDLIHSIKPFDIEKQKDIVNKLPKSYLQRPEVDSIVSEHLFTKTMTYVSDNYKKLNRIVDREYNIKTTSRDVRKITINNKDKRLITRMGATKSDQYKADFCFTNF